MVTTCNQFHWENLIFCVVVIMAFMKLSGEICHSLYVVKFELGRHGEKSWKHFWTNENMNMKNGNKSSRPQT